ncbi:WD40-repeat-containing domain protein [Chytriomyces sp. MP71]|nr:WD40-repeat-containing domain protein [Chytriomyces sp. MP71]
MKQPHQHTVKYAANHPLYALAWSQQKGAFRLATGSLVTASNAANHVKVLGLNHDASQLVVSASAKVPFPVTKIVWMPSSAYSATQNLLASSSDHMRIHSFSESSSELTLSGTLTSSNRKYAPVSAFDWCPSDPSILIACSIDTTCTVWDINKMEQKTQLIAHDKAVYDVAFNPTSSTNFASVGADGSLRTFDLRALDHSTILYETVPALTGNTMAQPPLLRLAWNKQDTHYMAAMDGRRVVLLDTRRPSAPLLELPAHRAAGLNAIAWAPHSRDHLVTVGEDGFAFVWDTACATSSSSSAANPAGASAAVATSTRVMTDAMLTYDAKEGISNVSWTGGMQEWIGIVAGESVLALHI